MCTSTPKMTLPAAPPPPPDYADQAVRAAAGAERARAVGGAAKRKSVLGATPPTPASVIPASAKKLLGA